MIFAFADLDGMLLDHDSHSLEAAETKSRSPASAAFIPLQHRS
ncbi:hypothetical protein PDO_4732 [Rhizobium sp. PDO1-076]|nr:hypothetical protein [uncultured Rhizobium sp.]EHS52547.1 hypothetical protein PDO_4732 [Rhizobium sp. PDO1-076]